MAVKIMRSIVAAAGLAMLGAGAPAQDAGEPILPATPYNYARQLTPPHFYSQALGNGSAVDQRVVPPDNPLTDEGATLGRVLFYDRSLSKNGLVSCASCHSQALGFDDPTRFSIGFEGRITGRHAMGLANAVFNVRGRYFWDERAASLEEQVLQPFTDEIEMGLAPGQLEEIVSARPFYDPLFEAAFGDTNVSEGRIARALAQFVRSLLSATAPYDVARARVGDPLWPFPDFTDEQNRGKQLFMAGRAQGGAGCASCHATEAFVTPAAGPTSNGLDADSERDRGAGSHDDRPQALGTFRVASLRNIAVRAPYMHDGRFSTLDEVIDHYSSGVRPHPNLGDALRNDDGSPVRFDFSQADRAALIAFLETLTDQSFLENPKFSDPFRR